MIEDSWIDIDGRDSSGNYYGRNEQDDSSNCNCNVDHDYIHPAPLTKEQVYQNQLQDLTFSLRLRHDELERFEKYLKEAEAEYQRWNKLYANKLTEIEEHDKWITQLKDHFGVKE